MTARPADWAKHYDPPVAATVETANRHALEVVGKPGERELYVTAMGVAAWLDRLAAGYRRIKKTLESDSV